MKRGKYMNIVVDGKNINILVENGETVHIISKESNQEVIASNDNGTITTNLEKESNKQNNSEISIEDSASDIDNSIDAIEVCEEWFEYFTKSLDIFLGKASESKNTCAVVNWYYTEKWSSFSVDFYRCDDKFMDFIGSKIVDGPTIKLANRNKLTKYLFAKIMSYAMKKGFKYDKSYQRTGYIKFNPDAYSDDKYARQLMNIYDNIVELTESAVSPEATIDKYREKALLENITYDLIKQRDYSEKVYQRINKINS